MTGGPGKGDGRSGRHRSGRGPRSARGQFTFTALQAAATALYSVLPAP